MLAFFRMLVLVVAIARVGFVDSSNVITCEGQREKPFNVTSCYDALEKYRSIHDPVKKCSFPITVTLNENYPEATEFCYLQLIAKAAAKPPNITIHSKKVAAAINDIDKQCPNQYGQSTYTNGKDVIDISISLAYAIS
ncbi:hypothetical protein CROQUDRAFT_667668 [Cronartium quercuum f. sp. fusiforme G11]|uniref:Uncharacterized protein n=1 Tax=Cronartium quercuum f. sp. fusiforme G11 TaxID=708437 RepID=A0A9P6THR2_9BASI|nr:hypothetical protein CROQUDRAFT_667668 [Cronartium quercuum f. sp. fusiforme G11]